MTKGERSCLKTLAENGVDLEQLTYLARLGCWQLSDNAAVKGEQGEQDRWVRVRDMIARAWDETVKGGN